AEDDEGGADTGDVVGGDVVIGIAASGRTPYVAGAFRVARSVGAPTALVTSNPNAELAADADYLIVVPTGPEAITGSTRLKAGTAQKLVLNTFSTALMVRLGRTYRNLMVDLQATNAKLRGRMLAILMEAADVDEAAAAQALALCADLKTALLYLLLDRRLDPVATAALLAANDGRIRQALSAVPGPSRHVLQQP
ncbi:MAG: N-acetylmuramic acid 6-phosphate etherase, partial [Actinomycetia bacterium]|nr:N-acetylmuramic acid 6-phosphate etherase [Actinomycetes bacterium]